jgi:twitching motility two-component system response regulator PilG
LLSQQTGESTDTAGRDVALLKQAADAYREGDKIRARELAVSASQANPKNELAWMWRVSVAPTRQEAFESVEHVLELNPENSRALVWRDKLRALERDANEPESAMAVAAGADSGSVTLVEVENSSSNALQIELPTVEEEPIVETVAEPEPAAEPPDCPICERQWTMETPQCQYCWAIVGFDDLPAMSRVENLDRRAVRAAVARELKVVEQKPTFEAHRKLAAAYLNLRQSNDALKHAREAVRLNPDSQELKRVVTGLEKRRLILAVDDSKTVQRMIATVLEKELYRVSIAEDGFQALTKLDEELPSLILLDITMPRMDGYQVCKVVTGNEGTRHIPVVMLSGKDGFFDKVRGKMVGASDYITKPFESEELVDAIRRRLN